VQIANLGARLNAALANKVEELSRYRSEFFGRLREILGGRSDVRVVGDRFVFQSEVLFASGDSAINAAGQVQLAHLAEALREISQKIPNDVNWILRVDGHTDVRPISTPNFPSNWELSTARALSVVRFLIGQGVPPQRLAATGFGPYQPLVEGETEAAYRRNRRIELKLTER
ncbi:MAG TPA: OmpA family protein, partial [Alphaproteobacteria bacterium]|nr:OmpA family protein [Alphaproteobacteria bacterium]